MEERAKIPVNLPHPNPTTSYWQDPPDDIADLRSTPEIPSSPDYVIIGSGISGASIAYNVLKQKPRASILMLEARTTCSGATGRNGGHTKAASYRSFLSHETHHGLSEAIKIARLEYSTIQGTHALARDLNIDCASTPCSTVDIIYDNKNFSLGKKAILRMRETMGDDDPAAQYTILEAEETKKKFLTPDALGAFVYEAGSISAYKFTIRLIKECSKNDGFNLQTNTAVESITPVQDLDPQAPRWVVQTPRGQVETGKLILATNGYTAHLLPRMQGLIVPLRGQITAQRPGTGLPQTGFMTTYSFIYAEGYEYMISRPPSMRDEGVIVIGGGIGVLKDGGASEYGNTGDTELNGEISTYLYDCTERYFGENWGRDNEKGRIVKEWSGVMGTSADGLPYVGEMPGMPGLFICASFNGHGMVMSLKCGEALVDMMAGGRRKDELGDWFPKTLMVSEERFGSKFEGRLDMRAPGEAMFKDRAGE